MTSSLVGSEMCIRDSCSAVGGVVGEGCCRHGPVRGYVIPAAPRRAGVAFVISLLGSSPGAPS
eukprot:11119844-Prorocentrum_lima.AAC.1